MQFAILSTAMLCAASFLTWLIAYLLPGLVFGIASRWVHALKGLDRYHIDDYFGRITQTAVNAALLYSVIFVVLMYVRERRLNKRKWEEALGSQIDLILWGGLCAGGVATLFILLFPYADVSGVGSILVFNLFISVVASMFFVLHMRGAARTRNEPRSLVRHLFGLGTWAHAIVALIAAIGLSFLVGRLILEKAPGQAMASAQEQFNAIFDKMRAGGVTYAPWFVAINPAEEVADIQGKFDSVSNWIQKFLDLQDQVRAPTRLRFLMIDAPPV
jgi:hypothetical protein